MTTWNNMINVQKVNENKLLLLIMFFKKIISQAKQRIFFFWKDQQQLGLPIIILLWIQVNYLKKLHIHLICLSSSFVNDQSPLENQKFGK